MHVMRTIVTDVRGVCLSVSLSVMNAPNDPTETRESASPCGVVRCSLCQITLASCFCLGNVMYVCMYVI